MCSLRPLIVVIALAATVHADQLPPEIEKQLAANARELSPLTIKWKQQKRPLLAEEKFAELLKLPNPLPPEIRAPRERELTVSETKIRSWTDTPVWGVREHSFDGDILYIGNHDDPGAQAAIGRQATLSKHRVERVADEQPHDLWIGMEYFESTGFWFPQTSLELSERVPPASALLKLLASDGKLVSIDKPDAAGLIRIVIKGLDPRPQRYAKFDLKAYEAALRNGLNTEQFIQNELEAIKRLQLLPTHQHNVFFLDPARGHAVARYQERTEKDELLLDAKHDRFEQVEGRKLWLPRRSITRYYTAGLLLGTALKEPILERTIEVSSIKPPPPDFTFALDYQHIPGATIYDKTGDKKVITIVPGR